MQDNFETMPMHTAAFVPFGNVGQLVSRLEDIAPPDMRMFAAIEVGALVLRTLDTHVLDPRNLQLGTNPASEIFIGRLREFQIEIVVVQRCDRLF